MKAFNMDDETYSYYMDFVKKDTTDWLVDDSIINNYLAVVEEALTNEETFSKFKSDSRYASIVGMSDENQATMWYKSLKHKFPLPLFTRNDVCGASLWESDDHFKISANTLHYAWTLKEIDEYFYFPNPINILELGVGYGGLCFVLSNFFPIGSYCLIDLPVVQKLAQKYLSKLNIQTTLEPPDRIDLFISEFCLSEFTDYKIDEFYDLYIRNANNIYLQMNLHNESRKQRFLRKLSKDFSYEVSDEFPKNPWPNYVIRGKHV